MALHRFSITRGGETYSADVKYLVSDMSRAEFVATYIYTDANLTGDTAGSKHHTFTAEEINVALSSLGAQTFSTAGQLKNILDNLAEQLARNKWED